MKLHFYQMFILDVMCNEDISKMAKQLKAIKCPQCGSVKKQTVKEDHYLCNNCNTEYFLDSDDINVNIKHNYENAEGGPMSKQKPKILLVIGVALCLILVIPNIIKTAFREKSSFSNGIGARSSSKEKEYVESIRDELAYTSKEGNKPIFILLIERRPNGLSNESNTYFMRFYDPVKKEIIYDYPMTEWKENKILHFRRFSDGILYICPEESNRVYQVNEDRNILEDITDQMFGNVPEFESGIATLRFSSEKEGDGFMIMTNNGKEYYYYPLVGKVYSSYKEMSEAKYGLESLLPGAVETVHYVFSEKSSDYPDEKIQLIKYWYKNNPGYPVQHPYSQDVKWKKVIDYPRVSGYYSGTYTEKKTLLRGSRFIKFVDLTPDRLYFNAKIVYQDSTSLYITGLPNANPTGSEYVQKIDTNTGEVIWTYTPTETEYSYNDFRGYKGGLVFKLFNYGSPRFNKIITIGLDGTIVNELDIDNLFK